MIGTLLALIILGTTSYYGYTKFLKDKLDCPANSEAVKGLEKEEIKQAVKDSEAKKKELEKEIKELENERKELLKDETKKEEAQTKLEEKQAKQAELDKLVIELADLKVVDKGGIWPNLPNRFTFNNALWIGGSILVLILIYKLLVGIVRSLLRSIGFEE